MPRFPLRALFWRGALFVVLWWILTGGRADSWGMCLASVALALVASLALRPRLDPRPGVLDITLRLPDGTGRVVLANTLNLLPGTLSVGLEGARLRLHVLDTRRPVVAEVRVAERHVARMFGLRLAVEP